MAELFDNSYTLGVTFLLVSMIIKKITKLEGIETDEITIDLINKYLPEIEKHLPEIRKQLPQLTKYCTTNKDKQKILEKEFHKYYEDSSDSDYNKVSKQFKPLKDNSSETNEQDFNTSNCIPVKHVTKNSCDNFKKIYNDEFVKLSTYKQDKQSIKNEHCKPYYDSSSSEESTTECYEKKIICHTLKKCDKNSSDIKEIKSFDHKKCKCIESNDDTNTSSDNNNSSSESCKHDKFKCKINDTSNSSSCVETNEINDRIKKIKIQLDKLSNIEEDQCEDDNDDDYECDDKAYIEHIVDIECREITEDEEQSASKWDLCDFKKKTSKPCKYECGEFAIDEDLNVFKTKVIKKAEIIIACYKKKLLECAKNKSELENLLQKSKQRNCLLEEKLKKCHQFLKNCEIEKKNIMHKAKKCEKELVCLLEKYHRIEYEYKKKKDELDKCHGKNALLAKEVHELKCELDKCLHDKNKFKDQVEKLFCALESCKKDKKHLHDVISKLKEKLKKYEHENTKLECTVRELREEIYRLNKKVKLLILQNKELSKENTDLRKQLGKTLATLKCLCDKYNALKKKCKHKKHCC
ncbi:hypothetical protein QJ856_gp1011 [Tupanvirus deep ocean]|uniref:Uncharacterized protein n=2 Tax=Tupanvirus TaxID=2094720 RepID=A0AC62A7I4_9VIRU|nr:hypothetical protein QJ856_gp1011 [Tupanvirus deep ocean]QKU33746.1 hypothetical protein [Tupanvirus deep ocean]